MILCTHATLNNAEWIIDSGATDHMSIRSDHLSNINVLSEKSKITLPNGNSEISSVGTIKLSTEIVLKNVLYVLVFKYNLLSVPKLTKCSKCMVIFHPKFCIIQDYVAMRILGVGREHRGLCFLKYKPFHGVDNILESIIKSLLEIDKDKLNVVCGADYPQVSGSYEVWHQRLGHASFNKLKHISNIHLKGGENKVCVTCPIAKLTRQPFQPSSSRSSSICQLIHMDI